MCGSGGSVCERVRRIAGQPFVWRSTGFKNVLRERTNRTAVVAGGLLRMNRQINRGKIKMYNRHEMLDLVVVNGKARGIIARNLITGEIERHSAHAVVIATGG